MYSLSSHHNRLVLCFHSYGLSSDSVATSLHRWASGTKTCAEWVCRDGKIAYDAKSELSSWCCLMDFNTLLIGLTDWLLTHYICSGKPRLLHAKSKGFSRDLEKLALSGSIIKMYIVVRRIGDDYSVKSFADICTEFAFIVVLIRFEVDLWTCSNLLKLIHFSLNLIEVNFVWVNRKKKKYIFRGIFKDMYLFCKCAN